jgi:hypothetical protein
MVVLLRPRAGGIRYTVQVIEAVGSCRLVSPPHRRRRRGWPRSRSSSLPLVALAVSLFLTSDAWAGQLDVQNVPLDEIATRGYALLGTIVSQIASRHAVRLRVKRIWQGRDNPRAAERAVDSSGEDVREIVIYAGVKWTDPRKSPIDRRVPGALAFDQLTVGRDVVIVRAHGFEALPADDRTLAKLDLFFSTDGVERYKTNAPSKRLHTDLGDEDLQGPALDAMCRRHLLEPRAFIALPEHKIGELGWELAAKLDRKELNEWLVAMIGAIEDGPRRTRLASLMSESNVKGKLDQGTRLALAASLDPSDSEQALYLVRFLKAESEGARPTGAPARVLVSAALKLEAAGSAYPSQHDELMRTLFGTLPPQERIRLVTGLAALVNTSQSAKKQRERIDHRLLALVLAEVKRAPEGAYVEALGAIDLSSCPLNGSGVRLRVSLLEAGLVIAEAAPSSRTAVYQALKHHVSDERLFPKAVVERLERLAKP